MENRTRPASLVAIKKSVRASRAFCQRRLFCTGARFLFGPRPSAKSAKIILPFPRARYAEVRPPRNKNQDKLNRQFSEVPCRPLFPLARAWPVHYFIRDGQARGQSGPRRTDMKRSGRRRIPRESESFFAAAGRKVFDFYYLRCALD